jgi:predicted permease
MKLAFRDRWEEECGHGAARLWLQTLADVACSATREHLDQLAADLRHAARTMWNDPSYAVVATAVLALGIAASTIAFTVLNATLIRPLPYPEADRLVVIDQAIPGRSTGLAWPQFAELIRDPGTLADIGGCAHAALTLTGDPGPEEVTGSETTFGMIPLLRVNPMLGRLFTEQEHKRGNDAVILLSHSLWRTRYRGDPAIIGKQIRTISRPFTVVGVMPPWFRFPSTSQFWVPAGPDSWYIWKPTTLFIQAFGRIHAGVTVEQARSAIETIMKRIDQKHDSTSWGQSTRVRQFRTHLTSSFRPAVLASMGAVGLVLLVSCANIGNLLLARASTRHRELSLRAALGANRSRIVRQLLVESMVLAALGGSAGLLLVLAVKPATVAIITTRVPLWMNFDWDWRILAFVACVSLLTSVVVGLVPAMRVSSIDPIEALKEGGKGGSASRGTRRTLNLLVIGQVAMAVLLLLNAGLLIRSFLNLLDVDVGLSESGFRSA